VVNSFSARETALRYLGRFSRTRKQVEDYLKRKQFPPAEIAEAIAFLQEHRFLNDDAFAESLVTAKIAHGDGPRKIKQMLWQKGIASETADRLIRDLYPVELQIEKIHELTARKFGDLSRLQPLKRKKVFQFLASRGFLPYVIIQSFNPNHEDSK